MLHSTFKSDENPVTNDFKVPQMPVLTKQRKKTLRQLYILTGIKGTFSIKKLKGGPCAPYFRLNFPIAKKGLDNIGMLLELFGIDRSKESCTEDAPALINVPAKEMAKINALFAPYEQDKQPVMNHTLLLDNLRSRQRLALINFLFSYQDSGDLEDRNKDKYDLTRIMLRVVDFVSRSLTSMDYLRTKGFSFPVQVPLELEVVAEVQALPITTAFKTVATESNKRPRVTGPASVQDNVRETMKPTI